jgi:DNA polymerase zeta
VYGDTVKLFSYPVTNNKDSLFVELPNQSKEAAFKAGSDIVGLITSQTPYPMKLKFEKVYLPCVLLAKKRYVGFKFENLTEEDPVFDAKGIETVRRDGCPAVSKILEKSLKYYY